MTFTKEEEALIITALVARRQYLEHMVEIELVRLDEASLAGFSMEGLSQVRNAVRKQIKAIDALLDREF